jgi:hypothetical protein
VQFYDRAVRATFGVISLALAILAAGLIFYAGGQLVAVVEAPDSNLGDALLNSVGYTVIAIAVFEVAKFIFDEEVLNPREMGHTGEARRSITKFISTIAIAVFLEALVSIFQASKTVDFEQMLYPTILLFAGVALIVGLGAYQRLSAAAETEVRKSPEAAAEEEAARVERNESRS